MSNKRPAAAAAAASSSSSSSSDSKRARHAAVDASLSGLTSRVGVLEARIERAITDSNTNIVQIAQRMLNGRREISAEIVKSCTHIIVDYTAYKIETGKTLNELKARLAELGAEKKPESDLKARVAELEAENKKLREAAATKAK